MSDLSQQQIRVLHVDDNPEITELTAAFLQREDDRISVETATNPDEGLQLLSESDIDCIVSDYEMPGTNGIEFLDRVNEYYPSIPFILYTGKGSEEVASEAISAGVTDYLQKKSGTDDYALLTNRILHAVESKQRERRIRFFEELEKELTELSIEFLQTESRDIDTLINYGLERLGTLVDADRTYVFDINHKAETLTYTYEWCSEGVEPQSDILQDIPQDTFPWWMQKLSNFENIVVPRVSELPPEAETEQEILQEQNIESLVVTPMVWNDKLIGFIGFDWVQKQKMWSEEFINVLRMGGELVMAARKREERQQELEKLGTTVEALTDAVYVINDQGQFTYANEEFINLVGYSNERILGSTPSLIKQEKAVEQAEQELGRLLSSDGPETAVFEVTVHPRDGEPVICEDHMGVLPYDGERFNGSVGVLRDVTDRKKREQELQELKSQYETLAKNFPDGAVFLIDNNLSYVRAGGEELRKVDLSPDNIEGAKPHDLFPDEVANELCHYYQEALKGNTNMFKQEYGGKQYQIQTVPVQTESENINYVMAVSQNVTERVETKQVLEAKNERLEEFASIVSHDLRSPLSVAEGNLELAQETCESDRLDRATDAINRSQVLIEDLLTLAQEGDEVDEFESVDLAELAEKSWQTVKTKHATLDTEELQIKADPRRVQELLENLYRNSVEHGGDGVTISVGKMDGGFYVADTGSGIPKADRKQVFKSGYSTAEDGTGFGLRIVKQIADAHGWKVAVTESEQGGARFEVTNIERTNP
jgi:PAS domain S-box-containing protein